ncbi:MAG: hypothetical protein Q8N77_01040 [Nanoarchaeota archaeon]|nr:hypothetical protein [Nanoarchaeota archaeon]
MANIIFLLIPAFVSFSLISLFDVHHSFYEGSLFPLKFIFKTEMVYVVGVSIGTLVGFLLIRRFILGLELTDNRKGR